MPPRVVLLTSPSLFGATIINRLAEEPAIELVGVGLTNRVFKNKGFLDTVRTLLRRSGWTYFRYAILEGNIAWISLRLTGRPRGLRKVARQVHLVNDVNSPDTAAWLTGLQPDFIVSYYFNQKIGRSVCEAARIDCVNVHPSLLPRYRGPDPVFRLLERGETATGVTVHRVADEIDAGEILAQREVALPAGQTHFGCLKMLIPLGTELLIEVLTGRTPSQRLSAVDEAGDYSTFPNTGEIKAWRKQGHRFVSPGDYIRTLHAVR